MQHKIIFRKESFMKTFKIVFNLDGHRTIEYIKAVTYNDAKKILEARYKGCNIYISHCEIIND